MNWLHTEPIFTLLDFMDLKVYPFESSEGIFDFPLDQMFQQFHIPPAQVGDCIKCAVEKTRDHSGLSKDCTELLNYIENIKNRQKELELFFTLLRKQEESIRAEAISRAKAYLPEGVSFEKLNVYFIPLPYNANADHRGVYLDPIFAMDIGLDGLKAVIAHEAHHIGRNSITKERLEFDDSPLDKLAYRFVSLECEGVANLVSEATEIPEMRKVALFRTRIMGEFEKHLDLLQEVFLNLLHENITPREARILMNKSWFTTAHLAPIGIAMASKIEQTFGRAQLIETVGDTVAFLEAYQRVAHERAYYLLEEDTFTALKKILKR